MRYIVLLPTYNERENVQNIIPEIFDVLPDADIMVIDDQWHAADDPLRETRLAIAFTLATSLPEDGRRGDGASTLRNGPCARCLSPRDLGERQCCDQHDDQRYDQTTA